jgi:hypothetical protein
LRLCFSGDHAVDNNVDGETKPHFGVAGDHLSGVANDEGKLLLWSAGEGFKELVDLLALLALTATRLTHVIRTGCGGDHHHQEVASPGGVLGVDPARRVGARPLRRQAGVDVRTHPLFDRFDSVQPGVER